MPLDLSNVKIDISKINYSWFISHVNYIPSHEGKDNVVARVHASLTGEYLHDDGKVYTDDILFTTVIKYDDTAGTFIPYDQLTPEILQSWLENAENRKQRNIAWSKNKLALKLDKKIYPDDIYTPTPWNTTNRH